VAFLCLALAVGAAAAPSVEDVMANIQHALGQLPPDMGFRQHVVLQVLLFSWRFHSDVVRRGGEYFVETRGAPSFLPPDVMASLVQVHLGLDDYDLDVVGEEVNGNGEPVYVLAGRRRGPGQGAVGGALWVNGHTWLVEKAVLDYDWGTLEVQQEFHRVDGYTVLRAQRAAANRLGARLTVEYADYWFGNVEMIAREDH